MTLVFFYGLFMDPDVLAEKGFSPGSVQRAYVNDFGLRIGEKATLESAKDQRAYGTVMELTSAELDRLYGTDGVEDYVPQSVQAMLLTGDVIEAVSYILPPEKASGSNRDYAIALAGVAKKLDLPANYIGEIETWI